MKKLVCLLVVLCLLPLRSLAVQEEVGVSAPSAVLIHPSGEILYEKNSHDVRPIASVTKIMTLLLVFEAVDSGALSMADTVTGSAHAASMGGSQIWLEEGETFTVEEMIKAVAIASANDCAVALAEHVSGSEEAFVLKMNQRAEQLGMRDTVFKNACGLDEQGHCSSAYDVALMSVELIKHDRIKEYSSIRQTYLRGGETVLDNTNKMLGSFRGMTGLKTGFTSAAGYCLSASAERDGTGLIAVVLGAETSQKRNADVSALLNWGFANFVTVVPTADRPLMPVTVEMGRSDSVGAELGKAEGVLAQKGAEITKSIKMEEKVKAPVTKGQILGELTVEQQGKVLARIPIVASEKVERLTFGGIFSRLLRSAFMR